MSDENQAEAPSPAAIQIPKERFDEVLNRNRLLEQQVQFQAQQMQTLSQLMANQRPAQAPQVDPELEDLKQRDPVAYKNLMRLEADNRKLRAATFSTIDRQDRQEFLMEYGKDGKKRLQEVEQILENERRRTNGSTQATRTGIYQWMLGQERLRGDSAAPAPSAQPQQSQGFSGANGVPPSDPSYASPVAAGAAGRSVTAKSFEDREKELENVEF